MLGSLPDCQLVKKVGIEYIVISIWGVEAKCLRIVIEQLLKFLTSVGHSRAD
jgi:hypothetical protein